MPSDEARPVTKDISPLERGSPSLPDGQPIPAVSAYFGVQGENL